MDCKKYLLLKCIPKILWCPHIRQTPVE